MDPGTDPFQRCAAGRILEQIAQGLINHEIARMFLAEKTGNSQPTCDRSTA